MIHFGFWLQGILPPALAFSVLAIAIYLFAKRFGPATAALSALFSLVFLSIVPILALSPLPKWWTVEWQTFKPAHSSSADQPVAEFRAPPGNAPLGTLMPSTGTARENQAAGSPSQSHLSAQDRGDDTVPSGAVFWKIDWDQVLRAMGILLIAGWCVALVRFTLGLRAVARYRFASVEIAESCVVDLARSIADQIGYPGRLRLRQSAGLVSAATIGWLHPVILLPANWESWTLDELRVVLAHEIGHIARRDYLVWILAQFSLSLHFYHPLAHWLVSRLRRDQELAADLLGSELCGGREKYLVTLSQFVLRQPFPTSLCFSRPVFSARGTFLWRMKMLHTKNFSGTSRLKSLPISLLAVLSLLIGLGSASVGISFADQPIQVATPSPPGAVERGKLMGRITAAGTGKPIEGARVRVFLCAPSGFPWWLDILSDQEGRYSHDLPLGHCTLLDVLPPPGYYIQNPQNYGNFAITKKDETIVQNFSLESGHPWKIELVGYARSKSNPLTIQALDNSESDPVRQSIGGGYVEAGAYGDATLTLPRAGGNYAVHCQDPDPLFSFEIPSFELKIEEGFDPTKMRGDPETNSTDGSIRLTDTAGKIATVSGAEAIHRDGHALVRLQCKPIPKSAGFKIDGIVQTEKGEPIKDAKVTTVVIYTMKNMNTIETTTSWVAYTGEYGRFLVPEILLNSNDFRKDQKIKLIVTKSGFDGVVSKTLDVMDIQKSGVADFGILKLKTGKVLKGKIVDEKGKPVQGAVVNCCGSDVVHWHLTCRSDPQGRFQIPDLSHGKMNLYASYGDQTGSADFDFDEKTGEVTVSLRPLFKRENPAPPAPQAQE